MFDEFLTIGELEANTHRLAGDPRVKVTPLGVSRRGRTIDMITIGEGSRDALVVGVPHPNEPAGAVTVERMIALLLEDEGQRRGYRWHFIKAIDPDGLSLNEGWLKAPRTITNYLNNFFRPALHRQPETTFPLDNGDLRFDRSTSENEAWQRAFALTRPCLHASLHHSDYGGVFYSLSRALPGALSRLEDSATLSGLTVNCPEDDLFAAERWSASASRYPSVPELVANAKASGADWAYPWTVGEMSPGFGETHYGSFTIIAEVPMWDAITLHDQSSSGVSRGEQKSMLRKIAASACHVASRHLRAFESCKLTADAEEVLWAIQRGLVMMPTAGPDSDPLPAHDGAALSLQEFETQHTEQALFALRTYGLLVRLADLVLSERPGSPIALQARDDARESLRREIAEIEVRSTLVPVSLDVMTGFQMRAIFVCADALAAGTPAG